MGDEAVTLFIQGHGSEYITHPLKNEPNVQLLSFVGMPGVLGQMVFCEHNDKPIDINIIEFLNKNYSKSFGINGISNNQYQIQMFNQLPNLLKNLYEQCDIIYTNGFSKIWPRWERYFSFKPGQHENCRLCTVPDYFNKENNLNNLGKNCTIGRCLPERNVSNICCPEYGLTVVASSFQDDIPFTLASKNINQRTESNMNMSLSTKDYWKSRTPDQKLLIDQIYNEKYIFLSQLITLFKSMGFKYIYLLDPTCRSCKIDTDKAEEYRALENTIPKEKIYSQEPNNIIFSSDENPKPKTNYFDDCINGVCGYFNKKKVDGGRKRRKTKKVFKNKRINRKTKKVFKNKNKKIKRKTKKLFYSK